MGRWPTQSSFTRFTGATIALLGSAILAGCATTGQTVALTAAGVAAGIYGANVLATRSKIDVTVEHFDSRTFDQKAFEQAKIAITEHHAERVDVVRYPSEAGITEVVGQVATQISKLEKANQNLDTTLQSFQTFLNHLPNTSKPEKPAPEKPAPEKLPPDKPAPEKSAVEGPRVSDKDLLDDFVHYARIGRYDLAAAKGQELTNRKLKESDFVKLVDAGDVGKFKESAQLAQKNEATQPVAVALLNAYEAGLRERTPDGPQPNERIQDTAATEKPTPETPAPEKPAPEKPAPEKPAPEMPAPEKPTTPQASDNEAAAYLTLCIDGLRKWRDANNTTLMLANSLVRQCDAFNANGLTNDEQKTLAGMIDDLRKSIINRDSGLNLPAYLEVLKDQLRTSVIDIMVVAPTESQSNLQRAIVGLPDSIPKDNPTRSDEDRIAAVLVAYLNAVFPLLTDVATQDNALRILSGVLGGMGIVANPQEVSRLVTDHHASKPDFVAAMVRHWSVIDFSAAVGHDVYEATFARFGIDFNIGSIREELVQALLTSPAINEITNPDNEKYWHEFSYARSQGQTGNHDVVVYMETLGLPVLKSSAFDPTKFQVASGLLYRKAFGAVVDVVGMPIAKVDKNSSTAGAAAVSNNLNDAKTARVKAEAAAKERQGVVVGAIKTILDGANAANSTAEPAVTATADREKVHAAAKKALQDAAAARRAAPKSDEPNKPADSK